MSQPYSASRQILELEGVACPVETSSYLFLKKIN